MDQDSYFEGIQKFEKKSKMSDSPPSEMYEEIDSPQLRVQNEENDKGERLGTIKIDHDKSI
jgi:hypothetical protein